MTTTRAFAQRRLVAALLIFCMAVGVGAWGVPQALYYYVKSQVRVRLEKRHLVLDSIDSHLSLRGLVIDNLEFHGDGLRARIPRVEISLAYLRLYRGARAIRSIAVQSPAIRIELPSAKDAAWLNPSSENEPASARARVRLEAHDASLELVDAEGTLLRVLGGGFVRDELNVSLSARLVEIASASDGSVAKAEAISLQLQESKLASLSVAHASLDANERMEHLPARLEPLYAMVSRRQSRRAAPIVEPPQATDSQAVGSQEMERGLIARVGALLRRIRSRVAEHAEAKIAHFELLENGRPMIADTQLAFEVEGPILHSQASLLEGRDRVPATRQTFAWDLTLNAENVRGEVDITQIPLGFFVAFLPPIPFVNVDSTRVSMRGHIATLPDALQADGEFALTDAMIAHTRIGPEPVGPFSIAVRGQGKFFFRSHRIELERGSIALSSREAGNRDSARLEATASGHVDFSPRDGADAFEIALQTQLSQVSCANLLHAIPHGLLYEMEDLQADGTFGGSLRLAIDSQRLDETILDFSIEDRCAFRTPPAFLDFARFETPFDHHAYDLERNELIVRTGPGTDAWTPIAEISPFMVHAVLGHEDANFFRHHGFSPRSIREALIRNLRERRYVMGASTITMQLVKNVYLNRDKHLSRKIREVLITWWLERNIDKTRLLELYLNVIEYGPNVYGIRQAAHYYFGREPRELSPAESAYLAMILPNPVVIGRSREEGSLTPNFRARMGAFIRRLGERGRYDAEAVAYGLEELGNFRFVREEMHETVAPREMRGATTELPIEFGIRPSADETEESPVFEENTDEP